MLDPDLEWEQWRELLGGDPGDAPNVYQRMVEMWAFRQIWDSFAIIHDNAPASARQWSTFAIWVRSNYARTQGVAIRNQADPRRDVVSLYRLIDRVWKYPTVLSRERYVASHDGDDLADGWFDELAGAGPYIDPRIPAQDIEDLQSKTKAVRNWVNKTVVHVNNRVPAETIPMAEIDAAIDAVSVIFQRYMNLIRGETVHREVTMSPWQATFDTAWIPDRDHLHEINQLIQAKLEERRAAW